MALPTRRATLVYVQRKRKAESANGAMIGWYLAALRSSIPCIH